MTPQQAIERARYAQGVLDDDLFKEAVAKAHERLLQDWASTRPEETVRRETLWAERAGIERIAAYLRSVVADGAMAASVIANKQG